MSDKLPHEVITVQPDGVYSDSGKGFKKISEECQCVSCVMCQGTGRVKIDHWSDMETEPCEDCENGIAEVCGRCEYLADLDRELF